MVTDNIVLTDKQQNAVNVLNEVYLSGSQSLRRVMIIGKNKSEQMTVVRKFLEENKIEPITTIDSGKLPNRVYYFEEIFDYTDSEIMQIYRNSANGMLILTQAKKIVFTCRGIRNIYFGFITVEV